LLTRGFNAGCGGSKKVAIPAQAGTQLAAFDMQRRIKGGFPACAGMTVF
jgi:hypothetical protein